MKILRLHYIPLRMTNKEHFVKEEEDSSASLRSAQNDKQRVTLRMANKKRTIV